MGDALLGLAVLVVLAIIAVPVSGSLIEWKDCGLYLPIGVNVSALVVGALAWLVESWVIGLALMALVYMLYAMFGSHRRRSMLEAERKARTAGQGTNDVSPQAQALVNEIAAFRALSRDELIAQLFKVTEKDATASDGSRGRVRIEVLPQAYQWEGGNNTHFDRLRDAVRAGGDIKVLGLWVPEGQEFLQRRRRVGLGFRVDAGGGIGEP